MKLLLDTVTFLWFANGDHRLSTDARNAIDLATNQLFLSSASAWEIVIKYGKGNLLMPESPDRYITAHRRIHHIETLPINEQLTFGVLQLPDIHRDPFDRIIIAQAIAENMLIVTPDRLIRQYPVTTIW